MRRAVLVALGAMAVLMIQPGTALAHPVPESYNPGEGATLSAAPSEVSVNFDENVSNGTLEVYDPCGDRADNGQSEVFLDEVSVGMSSDRAGTFTAVWTVVGSDSHKVSGDWTFEVSSGEPCPGSAEENEGGEDEPDNDPGDTEVSGSGDSTSGSTDSDPDAPAESAAAETGNEKSNGKGDRPKDRDEDTSSSDDAVGKEIVGPPLTEPEQPKDLPMDWMVISFSIAALMGAAGGQIYVNLSDPDD
jgi:methionine-rich copper-binding protein CopC